MNSQEYLLKALSLARKHRGFCAPNPAVGAVIVDQKGEVVGEGYHRGPGTPHAEIEALSKLLPHDKRELTLYVTLEPCCHYGKTPPCTDAIIKSPIKKIIFAYLDPNPIVSGKGQAALQSAGLDCQHYSLDEITQFYKSYTQWHQTKLPSVTAKLAMSLDGKYTDNDLKPIAITSEEINKRTHSYRKSHDAILTTVKTILHDNPQLNVRIDHHIFVKPIYILDRSLDISLDSRIFKTAKHITLFHGNNINEQNQQKLIALGVHLIQVQEQNNKLNLINVLQQIGKDGIHDVWLEAGATCFKYFIQEKLVNTALIYISPKIIGRGLSAFDDGINLDLTNLNVRWEQVGKDVLCEIKC